MQSFYQTIKSSYKKSQLDARNKRLPDIIHSTHKPFFYPALLMLTLSLFIPVISMSSPALAQDSKVGRFITNYGPLKFFQGNDNRLAGFYYYKGQPAHLFLNRNKNGSYKGYWVQASSEKKCAKTKNGSPYWGTIDAAFKGKNFLALWNFCNDPLINRKNRQWKGRSH